MKWTQPLRGRVDNRVTMPNTIQLGNAVPNTPRPVSDTSSTEDVASVQKVESPSLQAPQAAQFQANHLKYVVDLFEQAQQTHFLQRDGYIKAGMPVALGTVAFVAAAVGVGIT